MIMSILNTPIIYEHWKSLTSKLANEWSDALLTTLQHAESDTLCFGNGKNWKTLLYKISQDFVLISYLSRYKTSWWKRNLSHVCSTNSISQKQIIDVVINIACIELLFRLPTIDNSVALKCIVRVLEMGRCVIFKNCEVVVI